MITQSLKEQFHLRPGLTFLNFGSFGACPKPVMQRYQALQWEMEEDPVHFITHTGLQYLAHAREALAQYIGCHAEDVVYVTNPSYAVNTIAKSIGLQAGDEVLTTSLEYGACDKAWEYYCNKVGARYVKQAIALPLTNDEEFVRQFFDGHTAHTKLVFISHITSSTALRLPVEKICLRARELGLLTFVDGAHAPAHIPLHLSQLDADIYTGTCHKWMMAPKGSSFLYVKRSLQSLIDPLVISWGYKPLFPSSSPFLDAHQMNGTRDYTAFLTVPAAIDFMAQQHWWQVAAACRLMVQQNAQAFYEVLRSVALAPQTEDFALQMCSAEIKTSHPEKLHDYLLHQYHIQIPVMRHGDKVYLRFSINAFNEQADLDWLFYAIKEVRRHTSLIK